MNFKEFAFVQQRASPNFARIQKRRESLHLSIRGSALPKNDKRKRPTPRKGCCLKSAFYADMTNRDMPKTAYLRERSPCPRSLKFADFVWRTRAKLFFVLKIT